ncbi:F0F1 ATP synthase subunit delta [Cohnella sp. CFH 77786]|uniref:F0F1 ATP synthase subunit delta n=1 Tax=Cohnella sp. CFH 77786 TaxID=2662265 RepID=UPI001C6111E9|nr:F0F1 ATP synthase subunit delta [Cohnella sp. CFH 77786]MBW5445940.1 F0F1 ATP synthase subunit delta [Cohnella sp. CFH 77786]
MSRGTVVARRYAKALFELAREQGLVAETETQLQAIVEATGKDAEIRAFLAAPGITAESKVKAIQAAFGGKASSIVLNTISLLIERGRQSEIASLLDAYRIVSGSVLGRADALVTSAKPLSEEYKSKLAAQFGALTGKTVRVENVVDAELLGGLTVRIGDTLYDGSLRGKLDRLSKQLQTSV